MALEVILKQPVYGLGAEADLVKVKPGYARNFLFPRDLAVAATSASKKQLEELKKQRAEREARELSEAEEKAVVLNKVTITFQMESAENGKLFGSVTNQDIAERLAQMGHEVDRRKISLPRPLKEAGTQDVVINLGAGIAAKIKVVVTAPNATAEEAAEEEVPKKKKGAKTRAKADEAEEVEAE